MWYFLVLLVACFASLFVAGCTTVTTIGHRSDSDSYVAFGAFVLAVILGYGAARRLHEITRR